MLESLLITLREGFEAALVVSIVVTYLRRTGGPRDVRAAWAGVAGAVLVSLGAGVALTGWFEGLEGDARMHAFAMVALLAAGVLTWMVFWMRRQGRTLHRRLEREASVAATGGSLVALAGVTFLAVLREGVETALFLVAATSGAGDRAVVVGGTAGLALAVAIAWLVSVGGRRMPLRAFFDVTGLLLVLFAAGLLARSVQMLQAAGTLGSLDLAAYDLTSVRWLTVDTQTGRFLAGVLGWDPRPSVEQVVVYLLHAVPVTMAFLVGRRAPTPAARAARAEEPVGVTR